MQTGYEAIVRGGTVVTPEGVTELDVAIRDGRIAGLLPAGDRALADTEIDANGLIVTPGGIDTHTHVRWPHDGTFTTDNFYSATRAAVLGGTTTIIDFVPPGKGDLRDRCHARADEARTGSVIDFALHPILTSATRQVLESIDRVVGDGFTSFKMYTTYDDRRIDDGAAWQLMNAIAAAGGLPGFHAENHELLNSILGCQVESGQLSLRDYPASRPALAEAESIQMVSLYAGRIGTPVYIFHVSGKEAMDAVRSAKAAGVRIYAETCTHYLTLDDAVFGEPDAWKYVISPPLRQAADRNDLWTSIADGSITSIGSDHCAYDSELKRGKINDHRSIPAGAPGIEARTPLLFSGTTQRGLGYETFSQVTAERAAKALGLYPHKGVIQIGADADLVLWDANAERQASDLESASESTFSLYEGIVTKGRPRDVLVAGNHVVQNGEFVGAAGSGRFIHRTRHNAIS